MAKYFWKGTSAPFTTQTSGSTYAAWIKATNTGITANWAYSFGSPGSGVTGATALPGVLDSVYFSDKFPTLGSTLSSNSDSVQNSYVLSPCLNSSGAGITCLNCNIGPFNNQSAGTPPIYVTMEGIGSARVGGPIEGNSVVIETAGITGATLVGYPLNIRNDAGVYIYDNDMASYDINLAPVVGATTGLIAIYNTTGISGGTLFWNAKPWKAYTAIRLHGACNRLLLNPGVVLNELRLGSGFSVAANAELNNGTIDTDIYLKGQIINATVDPTAATINALVRVEPIIRSFDAPASTYSFGASVLCTTPSIDGLSPQTSYTYASLLLLTANKATGIIEGDITNNYTVVLGAHPFPAEPAYNTNFIFATKNLGTSNVYGNPEIKIKGTVTLTDFSMDCGSFGLDPTNVIGEYGLICVNGRLNTTGVVDFGGLLRFDSNSAESINLQKLGAMGVQHIFANGHYGLRVGEITSNTNPIKFYNGATVQTHTDSILPLY